MLRATSAVAVLGAALFFLVAVTNSLSVGSILATMIVLSVGVGASAPLAITIAISADPR